MAALTWNESYSVKIESIDDQHKKLFDLINEFYDNLEKKSNDENILTIVAGLKKYTHMHFIKEEVYMTKFKYPKYEAHKKEHDDFIQKVNEVEDKLKRGIPIVSFEVTNFIKGWIKTHILQTDMQYSSFFLENGVL